MGNAARKRQLRSARAPAPQGALALLEQKARRMAEAGNTEAAIPLYAEAISRGSQSADAFNDLGVLLAGRGQLAAAVVQLELAATLAPSSQNVRKNLLKALEELAFAAFREQRWADAAAEYSRLADHDADCAVFQTNAGMAFRALRQPERALPYLRRARDLDPNRAAAHFDLGSLLLLLNQSEAETALQRAVELDPAHADALVNLAALQNRLGRLDQAAATARRALEIAPDHVEAHANLGSILREQGEIEGSLEHYRRALALRPQASLIFSGYLLARHADPTVDAETLLADHRAWGSRFAAPLDSSGAGSFRSADFDANPDRLLRIGYVSADLRSHSVASFIEPLIAAHDRGQFHVCCYSDAMPDAVTARIQNQGRPEIWRDVRNLDDKALAECIARDRVDILVDLAGHTSGNRLLCFARRPAPIQVTYCGYPGTTGVSAIDWRLTDAVADPESLQPPTHVENLWRLPNGFLTYLPDAAFGPPTAIPSPSNGFVTYGSFNNLSKIGPKVLDLWSEILHRTPGAHLFLKARGLSDPGPRERLLRAFGERGIDPARIEFAPYAATTIEHAALYGRVDVALDPFPYNGATTTCEALWMGVPVVSLAGRAHAGRVGASLLTMVGHTEWLGFTPAKYVEKAVGLAGDTDMRAMLRQQLRTTMRTSRLMSDRVVARDVETAYRNMWRRWCAARQSDV